MMGKVMVLSFPDDEVVGQVKSVLSRVPVICYPHSATNFGRIIRKMQG